MDILYIIIPAYNEEENIEQVVEDWYPVIEKHNGERRSRLVVIDDGSIDRTYEVAERCAERYPLMTVLTKLNGGHGSAVLFGYRYAIQNHAQYIFQTDSDRQTSTFEFEQFWCSRKDYDAIIGNRNDRKDGKTRIFVEKVLLLMLEGIFHVKMPDSNAPYRLMETELVKKYLSLMPENYNLPNVILTTCFVYYKEKIRFIPITFAPRQGGKNSINIRKIVKIGLKALNDFVVIHRKMKNNEQNI